MVICKVTGVECSDCTYSCKSKSHKDATKLREEDIESYMFQFDVDRETAIKEIIEELDYYYGEQDKEMQDVYEGIKREMH